MVNQKIRRRTRYIIISLLVHILLGVMLFFFRELDRAQRAQPPLFEKKQKQHDTKIIFKEPESELPAALKPRLSNFGVPQGAEDVHALPEHYTEETMEQPQEEETEEDSVITEHSEEKRNRTEEEKHDATEHKAKTASLEHTHEIQNIEDNERRFAELAAYLAREEEKDEQPPLLQQQKPCSPQRARALRAQSPQPKTNIIAMTKGFIENLEQEGHDWLKRDGDESKRPTLEEMKYFSYEQRINWQLQSAWKRSVMRSLGNQVVQGRAVVSFVVNEHGALLSQELLQSSGHSGLDEAIMQNVKEAAPFPPLPKHFNQKEYKIGRIIRVMADRFGF